jgi:Outer membrane protein beta-barrel domain
MKTRILFLFILFLPEIILAQFEQKLSVNISAGSFKTVGPKTFAPEYAPEEREPLQMPGFRPGYLGNAGIQYNMNRHLSLCADLIFMYSGNWYYKKKEGGNWFDFQIYQNDTTDVLLAEGSNELTLMNISLGFAPKYYLLPGKKFNPYIFTGITFNYTKSVFSDNYWKARRDFNMLAPDDTGPSNDYLEKNSGIGFNPGVGVEYHLSDKFGFYISAGYYFVQLKMENFKAECRKENLHSINLQGGIRFSFLKSKEL